MWYNNGCRNVKCRNETRKLEVLPMYGIKMDKENGTYEKFEGTREELEAKGCTKFYKDEGALKSGIRNTRYQLNRYKFRNLSMEQLKEKSEEVLQIEREVFGVMEDYQPGKYVDKRIKELEENAQS
jgi:hypothetical protein